MDDFYDNALSVAKTYDVSTKPDSLVLYSISFLPTKENKIQAFDFVKSHPGMVMLDHTPCGIKMMDMGPSGNITAFVKDADERSVFRSMELPTILANENIKTINGVDKFEFAKQNF